MRKKILFVITKSNFGGAQRYVYDLVMHMPDSFDIAVAFGHAPDGKAGRLSRMLVEKDIRTIVIPELARDVDASRDWRAFRALVGLFMAEAPDIVHLNSSKAGGLGALAARIARVPRIVFTIHGLPSDEDRSRVSRFAIAFFTWLTVMLSHRTIAISNSIFERLKRYPLVFGRTSLIYNGIGDMETIPPHEARKELRSIDPTIPEGGFLVGTIAELHSNKDLATAIEAIERSPDAHFCIIGEGELHDSLKQLAREKNLENRVHFLGYIPDAARYLRAFDIFLLTSVKEGLPYVLLEAGRAHVPILATNIPGVSEIVLHNFTGLLSPVHDSKHISADIQKLRSDSRLAKSLVEEMAKRIQKTFSVRTMVEKTLALYR